MFWIIAWSVFMGITAYEYGGVGASIGSFVFWMGALFAVKVLIDNAKAKNAPQEHSDENVR